MGVDCGRQIIMESTDGKNFFVSSVVMEEEKRSVQLIWKGDEKEKTELFTDFFYPPMVAEKTSLKTVLDQIITTADLNAIINNDIFSLLANKKYRVGKARTNVVIITASGQTVARLVPKQARRFIFIDSASFEVKQLRFDSVIDTLNYVYRKYAFDAVKAEITAGHYVPTDVHGIGPDFNPPVYLDVPDGIDMEIIMRDMHKYLMNGDPDTSCVKIIMSGSRNEDEIRALRLLNPDLDDKSIIKLQAQIKKAHTFHHAKAEIDRDTGLMMCEMQIIVRSVHDFFNTADHTGPVRIYELFYGKVNYAR